MKLPTNNKELAEILGELQRVFWIDKHTMTEKLIRGNNVIYEAPAGTCLSHCLNDTMDLFAKQHEKAIHNDIALVLSELGAKFPENERLNESNNKHDCSMRIIANMIHLDSENDLIAALSTYSSDFDKVFPKYQFAIDIAHELSGYEDMFTIRCFEDDDKRTRLEILKDILFEYVKKLDTDPVCRELAFFHHVFNNDDYYVYNSETLLYEYRYRRSRVKADELFSRMQKAYVDLHKSQSHYRVSCYDDICVATLEFVVKHNLNINRCQNCGQYFVPRNRSDEIYCDNLAPQDQSKTCKQYGSARIWYSKMMDDAVLKQCKNLYSEKQMRAYRCPDVKAYADNFDLFKRQSLEWKKRYKAGKCTAEEFTAWLNEQKARKT